jgi:hypothetical protein
MTIVYNPKTRTQKRYALMGLFVLVLIYFLTPNLGKAQCQQYNLNISYDKQMMHVTPELTHNGAFTYKGVWYKDSIAIDQKKYTQNTSPEYKCLIFKYNNAGDIVAQIDLILPMPYTSPNLRLDPISGGLCYVLTTYNRIYKINNKLSINATNKSVTGIVRIDSNLSNVEFIKIGETTNNQRIWEGENDIHCTKSGATMLMIFDNTVYLNNGDSIKPTSVVDIYSLQLDSKFNVIQKQLLAENSSDISSYGMLSTPNGFYYFLKYYKSITVPSTNQSYSNALRKRIPGANLDGYDFLILKENNNQIVSSYTIGCPSTVRPIGMKQSFFYANDRFYFPHNNAGQNLYDNKFRLMSNAIPDRNALAIFDTSFRLTNLKAFEDSSEYTKVRTGFFASSPNEFTLTASTDSMFKFNGITYSPQKNANPTFMNVIYSVKGDSIYYKWSQNTENYKCLFSDLTGQSATFNLFAYPGKTITSINNMSLKTAVYKQNMWIVKVCIPELARHEIESHLIALYPNPVNHGILHIEAKQPMQTILVMNMQGQIVIEQTPKAIRTTLNTEKLPAGNYFVRTQFADHISTQKIIVYPVQ